MDVARPRRQRARDGISSGSHVPLLEDTDKRQAAPGSGAVSGSHLRDALHENILPLRDETRVARDAVEALLKGVPDGVKGLPREMEKHFMNDPISARRLVGGHPVTGVKHSMHGELHPGVAGVGVGEETFFFEILEPETFLVKRLPF